MATLVIRHPDGTQQDYDLTSEATVGRADGNELVLPEGGVSRRHARFFIDGDQVAVEDLGSANGTYVDGERIDGPTVLGPRAQVVIGDYEVSLKPAGQKRASGARAATRRASGVRGPGPQETTSQLPPVKAARATRQLPSTKKDPSAPGAALARRPAGAKSGAGTSGPSLRGLTGPWANKLYPIRGTAVVGRVAGVQIQLEDESVSRRHAEVERSGNSVVVRDLGSANGTTVNGDPVEGDVELQPGDIVQFGMIELSFEVGDEEAFAAPTRRGGAAGARASGTRRGVAAADSDAPAGGGKKKRLLIVGALVGVVAVAAVGAKVAGGGAGGEAVGPGGPQTVNNQLPPLDPKEQVEQLLSECRSYSTSELGQEPKWDKALEACEKARALDPINTTVLQLLQKIETERACQVHYDQGRKFMNLLREEEALAEFGKINSECSYYRIVKPKAREAIAAVKKKAAEDCKQYASRNFWEQAEPRCETYMKFACQGMSETELLAPPGANVDLWGRKCRKNCWRPKDPMFLNLLRAREKKDPQAPPWMCPPTPLFDDDIKIADPRKQIEGIFKEQFKEPLIREAMQLYWEGKGSEAVIKLHKLRAQSKKVEYHQQADELRKDIDAISNLYRVGSGFLGEGEIERAAENFRDVLEMDKKVLGALATDKPGFYRRAIEQEMADQAYKLGKDWADRGDFRKACRLWKLGFGFFRGQPDLNRAVGVCSNRGAGALKGAQSCDDLRVVLDYAVDGDGLKERVEPQQKEWNCTSG